MSTVLGISDRGLLYMPTEAFAVLMDDDKIRRAVLSALYSGKLTEQIEAEQIWDDGRPDHTLNLQILVWAVAMAKFISYDSVREAWFRLSPQRRRDVRHLMIMLVE